MEDQIPSMGLESRKLSDTGRDVMEPLLSRSRKSNHEFLRRLRHCHSSPHLKESHLVENPRGARMKPIVGGNTMNPNFSGRTSTSLVLIATIVCLAYLGVGIIMFYAVEDELEGDKTNSFVDALYFCIVTMTSVGYGDLIPAGVLSKLFASVYVFVGFGLVVLLLGNAANFLIERQELALMNALSNKKRHNFTEFRASYHLSKVRWKVGIAGSTGLIFFIIGWVFLVEVEKLNVLEAFYCVCATVTTLGYGDVSFHTLAGRVFAAIWILLSTINVAQFFLYIAELYTEERRQSFVRWVLDRRTTFSDLEAADMDKDGVVSVAEFLIYKLKELGKVEEEDVAEILKEFDSLDVDENGILSTADLKMAQLSES